MSKKNNKNNKSTVIESEKIRYVVLPKVPQTPQQSRSAVKKSQVKSTNLTYLSKQPNSKKSATGASYRDGFDVVNAPVKPKIRYEDFDEICFTALGTINYAASTLALNPAQSDVFPRLSNFAKLYDRYRFTKLEVYFIHDVSQYDSQGAKGLIILSCLYDAASANPATKQEQEMCNPHVIAMPSQSALLKIDPTRLHPSGYPLFTRAGIQPGSTDIKTYDAGKIVIGTQGMNANTEIGEIHIRGTVAFYDEIVDLDRHLPTQTSAALFVGQDNTLVTSIEKTLTFAATITNPLGIQLVADYMVFPAGSYLLSYKQEVYNPAAAMHQTACRFIRNGVQLGFIGTFNALLGTVSCYNTEQSLIYILESDGTAQLKIYVQATFTSGVTNVNGNLVVEKL